MNPRLQAPNTWKMDESDGRGVEWGAGRGPVPPENEVRLRVKAS